MAIEITSITKQTIKYRNCNSSTYKTFHTQLWININSRNIGSLWNYWNDKTWLVVSILNTNLTSAWLSNVIIFIECSNFVFDVCNLMFVFDVCAVLFCVQFRGMELFYRIEDSIILYWKHLASDVISRSCSSVWVFYL